MIKHTIRSNSRPSFKKGRAYAEGSKRHERTPHRLTPNHASLVGQIRELKPLDLHGMIKSILAQPGSSTLAAQYYKRRQWPSVQFQATEPVVLLERYAVELLRHRFRQWITTSRTARMNQRPIQPDASRLISLGLRIICPRALHHYTTGSFQLEYRNFYRARCSS